MRDRLLILLALSYVVSAALGWTEDELRATGIMAAFLPAIAYLIFHVALTAFTSRKFMFLLLSLPALLYAERQFLTVVLMVVPYLFSESL